MGKHICRCSWECRLVQPLWKTVGNFLRKLKMELPFNPVIPLLGLYPKDPESTNSKMGKGLEQTLLQGRYTEDPETYEKILSITSH